MLVFMHIGLLCVQVQSVDFQLLAFPARKVKANERSVWNHEGSIYQRVDFPIPTDMEDRCNNNTAQYSLTHL